MEYTGMRKTLAILFMLCQGLPSYAMDAYFVGVPDYSSGTATIREPNGGTYVYGSRKDFRPKTAPVAMEENRLAYYELVSVEEEEALLKMRDRKMADRIRRDQVRQRKAYLSAVKRMDWPRVVVKDGQVCVPTLEASDSPQWRDYLTCYSDVATGGEQ